MMLHAWRMADRVRPVLMGGWVGGCPAACCLGGRQALKPGGLVCVKDNCCDEVDFVVDKDDSSLTR